MNITYSFDYKSKLEQIYTDARWEAYYDLAIIPLLEMCCPSELKCVPVHETRRAGAKNSGRHFIDNYSTFFLTAKKKTELDKIKQIIKYVRGGIPDYIIVPKTSTYENPQKAVITVEFKLPKDLTKKYIPVSPKKKEIDRELRHQFHYCNYIILTDGVTWYFLRKTENGYRELKRISLYDTEHNCWKSNNCELHSEQDKDFFRSVGIDCDTSEEVPCDPNEWHELIRDMSAFIKNVAKLEGI